MNERRFISIPNHTMSQLGAVREVIVPRMRDEKNRRDEMGIYKGDCVHDEGLNRMRYSATFMRGE